MQITFDTENITDFDRQVLAMALDQKPGETNPWTGASEPVEKPSEAPAPAAEPVTPPKPAEPSVDLKAIALERAGVYVDAGRARDVKKLVLSHGSQRVGQLKGDELKKFVDELETDKTFAAALEAIDV